ncbi:TPA: hypothetical protein H7C97_004775, partial [Escherichia coli]|nr:hypothetical protein [Escherichia coli]
LQNISSQFSASASTVCHHANSPRRCPYNRSSDGFVNGFVNGLTKGSFNGFNNGLNNGLFNGFNNDSFNGLIDGLFDDSIGGLDDDLFFLSKPTIVIYATYSIMPATGHTHG